MNGISDLFGGLGAMTQLQLLFAFVAAIAYALAQGSLLAPRSCRLAWFVAAIAAIGFAVESDDWTHATVLLAVAIAGMGSFVAIVWLTSHALGFRRADPAASLGVDEFDAAAPPPTDPRPHVVMPGEHAHLV